MAIGENINEYDIIESMDVGEKIKFFREKAKLTQKELADKLSSYNKNYITLIENNKRAPSLKVLIEIADVLNIDLAYFDLDNLTLGKKIEYLREYYGYTQLEFAKKIKVTNDQLSRIENDLIEPRQRTITNIAKNLNMSVSELYDFTLDSTLRKKAMHLQEKE